MPAFQFALMYACELFLTCTSTAQAAPGKASLRKEAASLAQQGQTSAGLLPGKAKQQVVTRASVSLSAVVCSLANLRLPTC